MRKTFMAGLIAALVITGSAFIAAPASATEPLVPETKTIKWVLSEGGTADNVTWPQPIFDETEILCGTTVTLQVDTYPYGTDKEKARTDALSADGVLTYGEDHGWVISWVFETYTAPDCVVEPPVETPPATEAPAQLADTGSESVEPWLFGAILGILLGMTFLTVKIVQARRVK